ncbi:MAG: hypothetical protein IKB51_00950 [Clostridia bacterium]|nr:hypothetical protein [Clostridia bacterium]
MKKAKIISLVALTLCFIMVFASCGAGSMLKYYNTDVEPEPILAASTKVDGLGAHSQSVADLVLFVDEQEGKIVYKVYNLATATVVFTYELIEATDGSLLTATVKLYEIGDNVAYFILTTKKDGEVTGAKLFGAAGGAAIAESTTDPEYAEYNDEVIIFNGAAYMLDDKGAIVKSFDVDEFNPITSADVVGLDYNYYFEDDTIVVKDKKGAFVAGYTVPESSEYECFVLYNGNVVIQRFIPLPFDAADYDVYIEGMKFNIVTEIFNVKKNSAKEVEVDFIINTDEGFDFDMYDEIFVEDFDLNFAEITYVVDKLIDESTATYAIFDNNLKVKATVADTFDGAKWIEFNSGVFSVIDEYGNIHVLNEKGDVVKSITISEDIGSNNKYIWSDNAVYDYSFTKVYDLKANGYEVSSSGKDYLILTKDTDDGTEYARFYNGTLTVIIAANSTNTYYDGRNGELDLYCIRTVSDGNTTYSYYNGAGNLVATYGQRISVVAVTDSGVALVRVSTGEYYRLTPAA